MVPTLPRLHYVSQGATPQEHIRHIKRLVEAGCPWVQLRLKKVTPDQYRAAAAQALSICRTHGALLTINDDPQVAADVGADGVHVGTKDVAPQAARALLPQGIVGATANTWADVVRAVEGGADYIGLGPYRFTTTKQQLSPVLGLKGYSQMLEKMEAAGWNTPVLAIGGLVLDDVLALRQAGVWGIALSGALTHAADATLVCQAFKAALAT